MKDLSKLALIFCAAVPAVQAESYDRSKYNLFCPVPTDKLKPMVASRPGITESPFIIDPGHYQLEFDVATYTYDRNKRGHTKTYGYTVFAPELRIGLSSGMELDIATTSFHSVRTKDTLENSTTRNQGIDDTTVGLKYNFWNPDATQKTALAILPFVKIPTNQDHLGNKSVDAGIVLPFDWAISDNLDFSVMTEFDYQRGDEVRKHVGNFVNSACISYNLTDHTSMFAEVYTERSTEHGSKWNVTFNFGGSYVITDNLNIDGGAYVGLTPQADNITPFIGMSCRF